MLISDFKWLPRKKNSSATFGRIKVKLLVIFTIIVTVLFGAQLIFATNLATDGQKLSEIEKEIQRIETQNTNLKVKIAKASSLATLSKKAKDLGFTKPTQVIIP